ncbi:putative transposable element [Trichonephila clavipes]|nr:putative transposable element [Trichonephila clavipes]
MTQTRSVVCKHQVCDSYDDIEFPPKALEIRNQKNGSTVEMREGQKLTLQCLAKNSKPATQLKWMRNGLEITKVIYSQFGLAIHQNDHQARRTFVEWAQNEIAVVPDFHKRILFSDEAHFWLNGYVNKQNCRIWSEANPQVYVETPLHPEKLTVWCALWAGGIIGPYFFKHDEGQNVTVNVDRYRAMITNFFIPELNNHDVQELWFQQDGATCHTARATIDLLKDTFGDRLISRFGPVNWPPRYCDFTPLDYFLWGYVKSLVYADKPQTLDYLENNIRRVIADIRPQMLEKVIEN